MKYKNSIFTIVVALLLTFTPGALAADRLLECKTPPVTEAFIREMDDYMRQIEQEFVANGVPNCGKEGQMTLFGMDFYPDTSPNASEKKDGDYFADVTSGVAMAWGQIADNIALSVSDGASFREFGYSFASSTKSYMLYMDVQEANNRFRKMENLMVRTRYRCAEYIANSANPTGRKTSRYADVKAHYMAYKQLYYWLLLADKLQIPEDERSLMRGTSTQTEYEVALNILARSYTKLVQVGALFSDQYDGQNLDLALTNGAVLTTFSVNPFHVAEYVGGIFSQCQPEELGSDRIDSAVANVERAMSAMASTLRDTGNVVEETRKQYAQTFETFITDPVKATKDALNIRVNFVVNLKLVIQSNYHLYAGSTEAETASRRFTDRIHDARSTQGPTGPARTTEQVARDVTGQGGTLTEIAQRATDESNEVAAKRKKNMQEYYMQLMNNNGGENTNQLYLSTLNAINVEVLDKMNQELRGAADSLSILCKSHMPKEGEDCGETAN